MRSASLGARNGALVYVVCAHEGSCHIHLQSLSSDDRRWLDACRGVAAGDPEPLRQYLAAASGNEENALSRRVTPEEAAIIDYLADKDGTCCSESTLVDIALAYSQSDLLVMLCPPDAVSTAGTAAKRQPGHVAEATVDRIRAAVAFAIVGDDVGSATGDTVRLRLPRLVPSLAARTFRLPDIRGLLSPEAADKALARCEDTSASEALNGQQDGPVSDCIAGQATINWWQPHLPAESRLLVYWNGATGDCLLDAVAQAAWGVTVSGSDALRSLRAAVSGLLRDYADLFFPRWRAAQEPLHTAAGFSLAEEQVCVAAALLAKLLSLPWLLASSPCAPGLVAGQQLVCTCPAPPHPGSCFDRIHPHSGNTSIPS